MFHQFRQPVTPTGISKCMMSIQNLPCGPESHTGDDSNTYIRINTFLGLEGVVSRVGSFTYTPTSGCDLVLI